jgi:SAM-dependent methyltransferase
LTRQPNPSASEPPDRSAVRAFNLRMLKVFSDGMLALMVDLGHRTGLFDAAAAGPATSSGLAERAGLEERYVREWLGAMVTGGIFTYDASAQVYELPQVHAVCLTGPGASNVARMAQLNTHLAGHVPAVATAFRQGGGVPYSAFRPEFTHVMDATSRVHFDDLLVQRWLPLAPGVLEHLDAGARAADIGCGTGYALLVLARAFPASTFVGYDLADDAIEQANATARAAGLENVSYQTRDAAHLDAPEQFDLVLSVDAIHDQADPAGVLAAIRASLAPDGTYVMIEPSASSNLEDNVANPVGPWLYGVSTLHCTTVSLAEGGAGLGLAWGEQLARRMLADAGFGPVATYPAPGDPMDTVFVTAPLSTMQR